MRGSFRQLSPEKGSQSGRTKAGGRPLSRTQRNRRLPHLTYIRKHTPLIIHLTYTLHEIPSSAITGRCPTTETRAEPVSRAQTGTTSGDPFIITSFTLTKHALITYEKETTGHTSHIYYDSCYAFCKRSTRYVGN